MDIVKGPKVFRRTAFIHERDFQSRQLFTPMTGHIGTTKDPIIHRKDGNSLVQGLKVVVMQLCLLGLTFLCVIAVASVADGAHEIESSRHFYDKGPPATADVANSNRPLPPNEDEDIEVPPWHLYEEAGAQARANSLVIRGSDTYSYEHIQHSVHTQRQRIYHQAEDASTYHYRPLFPHHAQYDAGPERPPMSDAPQPASKSVTVAVYYYPWYHTEFHGRKYIRGELKPPQMPVLGEYNDRSSEVISQHLEWIRQANIDLLVSSWWGPNSGTDITIRDYILPHPNFKDTRFCLFYETMGRIDVENRNISNVHDDITYAAQTYFDEPNYHKIFGRPVLFVYLTRSLQRLSLLRDVVSRMRTAAKKKGHTLYIVGDHSYGSPPKDRLDAFDWLDAVTNYDIFGSMGRPNGFAGRKAVDEYSLEQAEWKRVANNQGCSYIPGATPGYNDKAVRDGNYTAMSRKITRRRRYGSLFRKLLREGMQLLDDKVENMLVVNSFNEWHEDTQIEPVKRGGKTKRPWTLTQGQIYRGYGELFLNILREETEAGAQGATALSG